MNKPYLTFELAKTQDRIEIHANPSGLSRLVQTLEGLLERSKDESFQAAHEHLMTPEWGGTELSLEKQGQDNRLVHHVKVFLWKE